MQGERAAEAILGEIETMDAGIPRPEPRPWLTTLVVRRSTARRIRDPEGADELLGRLGAMTIDLEDLYIDLHRHPELSFQETRTAGVIARHLTDLGIEFEEGIGKTGVVAVIRNPSAGSGTEAESDGPVVWLRADMDALPVEERTGLEYASTARGTDPSGTDVPVMHACGHDMHVTALLGALERLVAAQ